ncbi:alpha/beta hydrolase [Salinicoccus siamensis]
MFGKVSNKENETTKRGMSMKIVKPAPIYHEGGYRAIILLHSFTGTVRDVKNLAEHLKDEGYTISAPSLAGHGTGPDAMAKVGPQDWWQDVEEAYDDLKKNGHDEIAVAGVSLGGLLSLKAGEELEGIKGIVAMSVPMDKDNDGINKRMINYTRNFMKFVGHSDEEIEEKVKEIKEAPMEGLKDFKTMIDEVHGRLSEIDVPVAVKYGERDAESYRDSALQIFDELQIEEKHVKGYSDTSHLMTRSREEETLFEDITRFVDGLSWKR